MHSIIVARMSLSSDSWFAVRNKTSQGNTQRDQRYTYINTHKRKTNRKNGHKWSNQMLCMLLYLSKSSCLGHIGVFSRLGIINLLFLMFLATIFHLTSQLRFRCVCFFLSIVGFVVVTSAFFRYSDSIA